MKSEKNNSAYNLLNDAYRSFKKKKYNEAYIVLEEIVSSSPNDPYPYFLLAVVYFFADKFNKSRDVIDTINSKFRYYAPVCQLEAFFQLKGAASFEAALAYYIGRIKEYPDDRMLLKAVSAMRTAPDFNKFQRESKLEEYVDIDLPSAKRPAVSAIERKYGHEKIKRKSSTRKWSFMKRFVFLRTLKVSWKAFALISAFIIIAFFAYTFISVYSNKVKPLDPAAIRAIDGAEISGPSASLIKTITREKSREFYATTEALLADYNAARVLMKKGEYNKAVPLLNKIFESNASFTVKEKAEFLISFILTVDDRKYENISFDELVKRPWLYRGYALEWNGKIANLKKGKESRSFTMLVNYKDGDVFSGTAGVFYGSERPALSNGGKIRLRGIFINASGSVLDIKAHEIDLL